MKYKELLADCFVVEKKETGSDLDSLEFIGINELACVKFPSNLTAKRLAFLTNLTNET